MATRSSAKLLRSKSYAQPHEHHSGSDAHPPTRISGHHHQYIIFHRVWRSHWSFKTAFKVSCLKCDAPRAESPGHHFTRPQVCKKTSLAVKIQEWAVEEGEHQNEEKANTTSIFLPAKRFSWWFFYWHFLQCVKVNQVSWSCDGESTTTTGTEHLSAAEGINTMLVQQR